MILFGDIDFFTSDMVRNKAGQRLWLGFLSLLEAGGHLYRNGLPVQCEIHDAAKADLSSPEEFHRHAPDGGCRAACGATLPCDGGHPCPRRCVPYTLYIYFLFLCLLSRNYYRRKQQYENKKRKCGASSSTGVALAETTTPVVFRFFSFRFVVLSCLIALLDLRFARRPVIRWDDCCHRVFMGGGGCERGGVGRTHSRQTIILLIAPL